MPAEWEEHLGTIAVFPERKGSWPFGGKYVRPVFASLMREICAGEKVYLAVSKECEKEARSLFCEEIASGRMEIWIYACDDCWARDMAPTFVKSGVETAGVDWRFNAWGGENGGLYARWERDDGFAAFALKKLGVRRISARPFVLEGGSIHSDGAGVLLTTRECLLNRGRNPSLGEAEIEQKLKEFLGAEKVVWLGRGVIGDETDGHVDNACAFVSRGAAVLAWSGKGEQGRACRENLRILKSNGIKVIKLPFPKKPVAVSAQDIAGLEPEEGEAPRHVGERLAASYVNFYICNACVLLPQFGDKNDKRAVRVLKKAFPGKKIVTFDARPVIIGGGNVHCLTQQIPL